MTLIDIGQIKPNPEQPRKSFDEAGLAELAASIKKRGLIQPVIVEEVKAGEYCLVDGERRWRAAKLAGLRQIEAVVRQKAGKETRLADALVANIQREDMNVVDEARAFARLRDEFGWSVNRIQIETGASLPRVSARLKMLNLEPEILELFAARMLQKDERVIDALLSVPDSAARVKIAIALVQRKASIPAIQAACKTLVAKLEGEKPPKGETPAIHYAERKKGPRNVPAWEQLRRAGKLPSWDAVKTGAKATCAACDWSENPSDQICGACPAVQLIVNMVGAK
jgi:ParB/RepB/Spo0J family partition protein